MPDVPRVLLDHVDQDPPQAGRLGMRPGAGQLIQPSAGQRFGAEPTSGIRRRPGAGRRGASCHVGGQEGGGREDLLARPGPARR
jgi:hypothetical protein